jgi:hypothetical protein
VSDREFDKAEEGLVREIKPKWRKRERRKRKRKGRKKRRRK